MSVALIIPALDEIADLPATIARLRALEPAPRTVVVADGGSTDGTLEWLEKAADDWLRVVRAPRGRGLQMNAGAGLVHDALLVFLHADASLPIDAMRRIDALMKDTRVVGGAFTIRFARTNGSPRSMSLIAKGINGRALATRSATGDQAIFVRREVFERVGGFRPWPLFEDVDLVRRIKTEGSFRIVRAPVTISDRRYAAFGPWRTTMLMWRLRLMYWRGVPPERLKQAFADIRR